MGNPAAFIILSLFIITFALLVVSLRNIFHCALSLAAALAGIAGLYILLYAEFLAAVQILIYAGGVVALILFAIVLSQQITGHYLPQVNQQKIPALLLCTALFLIFTRIIRTAPFPAPKAPPSNVLNQLGGSLLTRYLIPFEFASLVLLTAVIGAICFVKREAE